jgi:hypothetical protein
MLSHSLSIVVRINFHLLDLILSASHHQHMFIIVTQRRGRKKLVQVRVHMEWRSIHRGYAALLENFEFLRSIRDVPLYTLSLILIPSKTVCMVQFSFLVRACQDLMWLNHVDFMILKRA